MKTTVNISIKCSNQAVLDLAVIKLKEVLSEITENLCNIFYKYNLKIDILSD